MHLADGILSSHPELGLALNFLGVAGTGLALREVRHESPARLAWAGTLGAFVLAAQAINLPIASGASAHAIGAGLVTLLLGPSLAIAVLASVLVLQAILLADGGLTVIGINLLNIAILPTLATYAASRVLANRGAATAIVGTVFGAFLASMSLAATLVVCANAPAQWTMTWLVGLQCAAGAVEGVLTWIAVRHLKRQAPGLIGSVQGASANRLVALDDNSGAVDSAARSSSPLRWAALALLLLVALPPLASSSPDALEVVVNTLQLDDNK